MRFKLFTEQEVTDWFKIPKTKLRNMRTRECRDPLPYVKIGGAVRYREDQIIRWLDRNTFPSTTEYFMKIQETG